MTDHPLQKRYYFLPAIGLSKASLEGLDTDLPIPMASWMLTEESSRPFLDDSSPQEKFRRIRMLPISS